MRKWIPLAAICLGAFMLLVDVSIVNVALPDMSADLHSSFTSLQWVVDIYALTLAALLMVCGSLGDRLGHRRLYLTGLVVFAAASLVCALAPDAATLITARAVQGVGGAAMMTSTTALIAGAYQGRDRGTAFGVWGAVNGAAAAVGPVLGGLLTDQFGWRAIFMVNLPVAAVALAMTLGKRLALPRAHAVEGRIDSLGAVAFTVFAAALTYGLIESGDRGWGSAVVLGSLVVSALALIVFVATELRVHRPLLDLSLLRGRSFVGLLAGGLLLSAAAFAELTYTSLWLQQALHLSPLTAGLAVSPMAATAFVVALATGRALHRFPPQLPIGVGLLFIGIGTLLLTAVSGTSGWTALLPGMLVTGVGVGLSTPMLMATALASVSPQRAGMASGALNTARQLGYALGIAVLGTIFQQHAHGSAPRTAFAAGLHPVFLTAGLTGLAAGLLVLALVRRPHAAAPATAPLATSATTTAPADSAAR
ncbi:MFS transporter [Streptacidiphilus jiangxiensis]|uniref:Drug resistance transporter, EmrB/QacA subfamily n=1 Tax=Streptacidiphilus jiangxiensis TaxID=235985 RepID=A0A1H7JUD1_STRJI|nr:MFS transporter [Streptacidiphilus jiangxiensis]SEK77670.1 drug resistance transporter, EmrB/QacA subfamily [Streptacidiphilus jiangxiensis]